MAKNPNGRGTIRKRKDGTWEARYTAGVDPRTGKQIQKSVYAKTQKEVSKKLTEITRSLDTGTYADAENMTLQTWLGIWLETYVKGKIKHSSYCAYEKDCRVHIVPYLGPVKLRALRSPMVQDFYNYLIDSKGLSPKTVKNIHGVLHQALGKARKVGYIYTNYTEDCDMVKATRKEIKPLSTKEVKRFLEAVSEHKYRDIFLFTLFTGVRQGEALGLTWDCVDFDNGTVVINKQLQLKRGSGGIYELIPTKSSTTRTLYPPQLVMGILRDLWSPDVKYNEWNLVFVNEQGGHLGASAILKSFKRLVKRIGIPDARFHDLRHTFAVISLQEGDNIKTVQRALGHATVAFTLDVYGHVSQEMRENSKRRMDKYIQNLA